MRPKGKHYYGEVDCSEFSTFRTEMRQTSEETVFVYNGMLCYGERVGTIKAYANSNTSKSFLAWLRSNKLVIDPHWV